MGPHGSCHLLADYIFFFVKSQNELESLFPRHNVSDLDKREDSDAVMAEVMSGFINLFCNSSERMKPNAMKLRDKQDKQT